MQGRVVPGQYIGQGSTLRVHHFLPLLDQLLDHLWTTFWTTFAQLLDLLFAINHTKNGTFLVQKRYTQNRHFCVTFASLFALLPEHRLLQA